jgi:hypothetical protein
MITIPLFLVVLGLVFAALATFKVPELPRFSFGWAAVLCYLLSILIR